MKQIEDALIPAVEEKCSTLFAIEDGYYASDYDVISGLSGIGGYLLNRINEPRIRSCFDKVVETLVRVISFDGGKPRFHTPTQKAVGTLSESFPTGFVDCGISHGIAGPIAFLGLACIHDAVESDVKRPLRDATQWLTDQAVSDRWGMNWPAAIPTEYIQKERSGTFGKFFDPDKPTKTAWCYGAPGISCALWLSGLGLDDGDFQRIATSAMQAALQKPKSKRYMNSYGTFCHGVAGLMYITLLFAKRTGNRDFVDAVPSLFEQQIGLYLPQSASGFMRVDFSGDAQQDFGILDGAAGAALSLLALLELCDNKWARLFLID